MCKDVILTHIEQAIKTIKASLAHKENTQYEMCLERLLAAKAWLRKEK